jgi:DNA polymerase-3 subunit gamma/tau
VCQACTEIDEGRFVDYLELDAASNRGVEEMTQLLEQAVYSPSVGRFKVYMIDEVHMLSGHAFNAMLKTLEEPPPHVKFILATTDPQKIPVTVLSRCLQFNLKQMPGEAIVGHLENVLAQEQMPYEVPALRLLGQAAGGSMRDALSLTDQAIAYSAGNLTEEAVRGMLGTIDQRHLVRLLDALEAGQASTVLEIADELATRGLSYRAALADLAVMLSRIAIVQRVPQAVDQTDPIATDLSRFATSLHSDVVQLFYTVAVHSRNELVLAPDEYAGFVMACLRMLALVPRGAQEPEKLLPAEPAPQRVIDSTPIAAPNQAAGAVVATSVAAVVAPVKAPTVQSTTPTPARAPSSDVVLPEPWAAFSAKLPLTGMAMQLARQSECVAVKGRAILLRVSNKALSEGVHAERLRVVLKEFFGQDVQVAFEIGVVQGTSAHALDQAEQQSRQQDAEASVQIDPFVQALVKDFGAQVVPGSVRPGQSNSI